MPSKHQIFRTHEMSSFDLQTERLWNLLHDIFAVDSQLWNNFINLPKSIFPSASTTSHWMSSCCHVRQFSNSSSTWLINPTSLVWSSDCQLMPKTNSFFDGLSYSYAGKDDAQCSDVSVSTAVVMKLKGQIFQLGCDVRCDNFFTSLDLVQWLAEKTCSLVR